MSKGILHLAVTGQVPLQLQYRNLRCQVESCEAFGDIPKAYLPADDMSRVGNAHDLTYVENLP
jgi:hypothetical protein